MNWLAHSVNFLERSLAWVWAMWIRAIQTFPRSNLGISKNDLAGTISEKWFGCTTLFWLVEVMWKVTNHASLAAQTLTLLHLLMDISSMWFEELMGLIIWDNPKNIWQSAPGTGEREEKIEKQEDRSEMGMRKESATYLLWQTYS